MIRVLMVCLGNICRSPMAEFIFRDMAEKRGLGGEFFVASAATSDEEHGNPVYPPAKRKLYSLGIDCHGKRARQMTKADYDEYDLLLGMEDRNLKNMRRICGGDPQGKSTCCWSTAPGPGTSPTPGIPAILTRPATISWRAADSGWTD